MMFNKHWTETEHAECKAIVARWVSLQAIENNPAGMDAYPTSGGESLGEVRFPS